MPASSKIPDSHPAIEGIFNLRGIQVPAVNLARWLHLDEVPPEDKTRKVIVAEFGHYTVGFIIHHAHRIRRISWNAIKNPPDLVSQRHGASIVGTTLVDNDQTLLLIDVEKVVAEIEGKSVEERVDEQMGRFSYNKQNAHLLIVDDSPVARKQLSITLGKIGYRITQANDGLEALDRPASPPKAPKQAGLCLTKYSW
jgi:two-component system chemotaxis response regulator CheV